MEDDVKPEIQLMRQRIHGLADVVQGLVTRDATMALQVTNLVSMVEEHKSDSKEFMGEARQTLAAISKQVTETNGRVNGHDREIRDIKDTLSKALWWLLGLNATVIAGVVVYWVNNK